MELYQLRPQHKNKSRKRVGRGGKRGTYSGRGIKGQMSRAGRKPRPGFSGGDTMFYKRMPKQRGKSGGLSLRKGVKDSRLFAKPVILNLSAIEKVFKDKEIVSSKSLFKKGLISKMKGRTPKVKILAKGKLSKKVIFRGVKISKNIKQ